jgi:peptidoglycan/LPS O-acetylase OafA/YrhL
MKPVPVSKGSAPSAKIFFPNLDGLRFFAFFLVFLQHGFGSAAGSLDSGGFILSTLKKGVFNSGGVGVSFFFVLSGFLITYLILSEIRLNDRLDVLSFYTRRVLRIWPLYYLVIAFGFLFYPFLKSAFGFSSYIETGNPVYYFLFLGNFDVIHLGQGHGAMSTNITWSVAIEEQFYIVWPLLFFFVRPRFYRYLFPAIILASFIFRLTHTDDSMVLYFHSLSVISDMAVGGMAAYLSIHSASFTRFFAGMRKPAIALVYLAGISIILFGEYLFTFPLLAASERAVFTIFFAFVIVEQNYAKQSLIKVGNLATVSTLGRYTYGLYLLHPVAILICSNSLRLLQVGTESRLVGLTMGLVALAVSIGLSYLSYHFYERRFLNLKQRFSHIISSGERDDVNVDASKSLAVTPQPVAS